MKSKYVCWLVPDRMRRLHAFPQTSDETHFNSLCGGCAEELRGGEVTRKFPKCEECDTLVPAFCKRQRRAVEKEKREWFRTERRKGLLDRIEKKLAKARREKVFKVLEFLK